MHPDTQDLLEIIDGVVPEHLAEHLASCAVCQQELAALDEQRVRLRALPGVAAPPPSAAVLGTKEPSLGRGRMALAASVALLGLMVAWFMRSPVEVARNVAIEPVSAVEKHVSVVSGRELRLLAERSARLERQWQYLNRTAPRVRRAAHEFSTAPLKTGLMQLDARYAQLPQEKYWRQRVQMLDTLVTLEQTERLVQNNARFNASRAGLRSL